MGTFSERLILTLFQSGIAWIQLAILNRINLDNKEFTPRILHLGLKSKHALVVSAAKEASAMFRPVILERLPADPVMLVDLLVSPLVNERDYVRIQSRLLRNPCDEALKAIDRSLLSHAADAEEVRWRLVQVVLRYPTNLPDAFKTSLPTNALRQRIIIGRLEDLSSHVRAGAIQALAETGTREAIPHLERHAREAQLPNSFYDLSEKGQCQRAVASIEQRLRLLR